MITNPLFEIENLNSLPLLTEKEKDSGSDMSHTGFTCNLLKINIFLCLFLNAKNQFGFKNLSRTLSSLDLQFSEGR